MADVDALISGAIAGERRSLARIITLVENSRPGSEELLAALFSRGGNAYVIGLTGAPGAGKSTITDHLITRIRSDGHQVAVLAVDPSSPFTGGAILGDRIRMQDHAGDPGVYIRSMGSRGHLGGVAAATPKVVAVLDGIGMPYVLVETVGVGQAEVEIIQSTDTTVVVVNPGWGDSIQANKAGLLEIGDLFVVNKADRPGVPDTTRDLRQMLELGGETPWSPPILATVAHHGEGIDELWAAILDHRVFLEDEGRLKAKREERLSVELRRAIIEVLLARAEHNAGPGGFDVLLESILERHLDPWSAARKLAAE